jgi:hypothetical protein
MNLNAKMLDFSNKFDDPAFDILGDLNSPTKTTSGVPGGIGEQMSPTKIAAGDDIAMKKEALEKLKKEENKGKKEKVKPKKPKMVEFKEMEKKI